MKATKYNIETHFLVRHYPRRFSLLSCLHSAYRKKTIPYTISYKSDGEIMTISYAGPEFGIKELREKQEETKDIKREYGGNGARIILAAFDDGKVEYVYCDGINIWRVKGDFNIFDYEQKIPKDTLGFVFYKDYNETEKDPVMEISYNIIAHHNIIYPKNTTLFILKTYMAKYLPKELGRKIRWKICGFGHRNAEKRRAKADKLQSPDITIPGKFRHIGFKVFEGREDIVNVTIPKRITIIDVRAFENCINLASITIPESVKRIDACAFRGCKSLMRIKLPKKVIRLYHETFNGCENLREVVVPDGKLIAIYDKVFKDCKSLKEIYIPKGVADISEDAFSGCSAMENITVDMANNVYCDIDGVLFSKDKKTLTKYPAGKPEHAYEVPDGVVEIMRCAFEGCSALRSVRLPESFARLGNFAFKGCSNLSNVAGLNSDVLIPKGAFEGVPYCGESKNVGRCC